MKIKDIAKVTNGKSDVKEAVSDGKYLFFDRSTIVKRSNKFLFDSKSIIIPGEDSRMVFEPRYYEGKFNLHQRCYVIYDLNQKYSTKYLYYKLKTLTKHFANVFVGSTVPSLRLDHITDLDIEFPIFDVQQKIASVLSALDSKIELNNRINAEIEAMAKTLYDYWFVQFDFPDKNGKPYKTSGGKMVWNEELKREIPHGWAVCSVDEVKVVAAGVDYSYLHSTPNRLKNTITISGSGANAGFINFWREPIFASDCITVRGKSDAETLILLQYLNFIQPHILSQATGSAQPHVYPSDIKVLNYVVPTDLLIDNYGKMTIPMNEKIGNNLIENKKLTELRDWLLPMLMNGQVKVN
jgi:type I restriction enzyme S subunit